MRKTILSLILILAMLPAAIRTCAQESTYKFDLGGQFGMAGYLGDASQSIFAHPGFSAGASFRYLPDVRWAVRTVFNVMSLSGDTKDMIWVDPGPQRSNVGSVRVL